MKKSDLIRFEKFCMPEPNTGCWLWMGCCTNDGYGRFSLNKKAVFAHRASYFIHKGKIINGKNVLHKCDNPYCVNPDHLFLGTRSENMQDMILKGRQYLNLKGKCPAAKLSDDNVREIRLA